LKAKIYLYINIFLLRFYFSNSKPSSARCASSLNNLANFHQSR